MKRNFMVLVALFIGALVAGYLIAQNKSILQLDQYAPMPPGGDFNLQSAKGEVALQDFTGKVVLVYFGYSYCPDICPTSLALTSAALSELTDEERAQVQAIFISVDPQRDTPERLATYTAFFHPNMLGLTGNKTRIDDVVKRYGAFYRIVEEADDIPQEHSQAVIQSGKNKGVESGYVVDHSSQTVVLGKNGKVQAVLPHGAFPDEINQMIRAHL